MLALTVLLSSCGTSYQPTGVSNHTGYFELPFPSNVYAPGQIVEIYTKPTKKVEITQDTPLNWDQMGSSPGWNISDSRVSNVKGALTADISEIVSASTGGDSTKKVVVSFTDTETVVAPKSAIFKGVTETFRNEPMLLTQIKAYQKKGTHFSVITSTLKANVTFDVKDSNNASLALDSDVIEKINTKLKLDFHADSSGQKAISGKNLVIGIHHDPKLVDTVIESMGTTH